MSDVRSLKVFISWSGEVSKQVALHLRDLLPVVFDGVTPWMSDRDIEAGGRSMQDIASELDATAFGLVVITRDNQQSQWLNFEAGALSKRFGSDDDTHVVPLLVDLDSIAELTGPLTQFQVKLLNRAGIDDTFIAIGTALGVSADVVRRRLGNEWDDFSAKVKAANAGQATTNQQPRRSLESMVEESLELLRSISSATNAPKVNQSGVFMAGSGTLSTGESLVPKSMIDSISDHVLQRYPNAEVTFRKGANVSIEVHVRGPEGIENDEKFWREVIRIASTFYPKVYVPVIVNGVDTVPF